MTLTQAEAVLKMESKIKTQSKHIDLLNNTLTIEKAVSDSLASVVVLNAEATAELSRAYDFKVGQTESLQRSIATIKRKHNAFKGLAITTLTAVVLGFVLIK